LTAGTSSSRVKTTFMRSDGLNKSREDIIKPRSRYTIHIDEMPGYESADMSTLVEVLDGPGVIAERSMYFSYQNLWRGGHDAAAVLSPSKTWYFAEGYTGN
jgi:hypothetical protein